MYPPFRSELSSQCAVIILLSAFALIIASRIIDSLCTPRPSSENAITFAAIPSKSESSSPFSPIVIAPYGYTPITASLFIISVSSLRCGMLSGTGFKFGMAHTSVYPPLAAALDPLAIVSLYEKPGSRKCTCTSQKPGNI